MSVGLQTDAPARGGEAQGIVLQDQHNLPQSIRVCAHLPGRKQLLQSHSPLSGTDSSLLWVQGFYLLTVSSFLFLLMARTVNSLVLRIEKRLEKHAL